ncbi:hypothetical protein GCM10010468_34110 [Actinocorallia longicatena]|uniref:Uncharacterized protein n=1 Tax=Actinocorallia longicatena TaxID=111803 RepID=A0ABP6QFM7_9ACTN
MVKAQAGCSRTPTTLQPCSRTLAAMPSSAAPMSFPQITQPQLMIGEVTGAARHRGGDGAVRELSTGWGATGGRL